MALQSAGHWNVRSIGHPEEVRNLWHKVTEFDAEAGERVALTSCKLAFKFPREHTAFSESMGAYPDSSKCQECYQ